MLEKSYFVASTPSCTLVVIWIACSSMKMYTSDVLRIIVGKLISLHFLLVMVQTHASQHFPPECRILWLHSIFCSKGGWPSLAKEIGKPNKSIAKNTYRGLFFFAVKLFGICACVFIAIWTHICTVIRRILLLTKLAIYSSFIKSDTLTTTEFKI